MSRFLPIWQVDELLKSGSCGRLERMEGSEQNLVMEELCKVGCCHIRDATY
jgi:hypothetical protein